MSANPRPTRLSQLGWDDEWERTFAQAAPAAAHPGRVAITFNHIYRVYVEEGELETSIAGRLKHRAVSRSELPAVGDWVAVRRQGSSASISAVLPRRSQFSRKAAGQVTDEQVVAANVDVVFIVMGLDGDYNVRRLERYLLQARDSGAVPVVLLTKPDLAADVVAQTAAAAAAAGHAFQRPRPSDVVLVGVHHKMSRFE